MPARYHLKSIRSLLNEGFTDEELRRFCFDTIEFRPVYDQLAHSSGKVEIIDRLIEYGERKDLLQYLLNWAAAQNPPKYALYQPYADLSTPPPFVVSPGFPSRLYHIRWWVGLGFASLAVLGGIIGTNWSWTTPPVVSPLPLTNSTPTPPPAPTPQPTVTLPPICQTPVASARLAVAPLTNCPAGFREELIQQWDQAATATLLDQDGATPADVDLAIRGTCVNTHTVEGRAAVSKSIRYHLN